MTQTMDKVMYGLQEI